MNQECWDIRICQPCYFGVNHDPKDSSFVSDGQEKQRMRKKKTQPIVVLIRQGEKDDPTNASSWVGNVKKDAKIWILCPSKISHQSCSQINESWPWGSRIGWLRLTSYAPKGMGCKVWLGLGLDARAMRPAGTVGTVLRLASIILLSYMK